MTLVAAASLGALLVTVAAQGQWAHPSVGALALIIPGGPAVALLGVGAWSGARWQSAAAASTAVLAAWLAQLLIWDRFVGVWQLNKTLLLAIGVGLVVLALRRLTDTETLLAATQREDS